MEIQSQQKNSKTFVELKSLESLKDFKFFKDASFLPIHLFPPMLRVERLFSCDESIFSGDKNFEKHLLFNLNSKLLWTSTVASLENGLYILKVLVSIVRHFRFRPENCPYCKVSHVAYYY